MWLPAEGFYSQFKYVEVASYVPSIKSVIRYQDKEKTPILLESPTEVHDYFDKKGRKGAYTSVWRRKTNYIPDTPHPVFAPLYFDFDDKDDLQNSANDARKLIHYLQKIVPAAAIQTFFTGYKGFHIEINPIVFNVFPSADLPEIYIYITSHLAKELDLSTMDTQVRDSRRMWRLTNSQHQITGLYKVQVDAQTRLADIKEYAASPQPVNDVPVEFNVDAAQWFRELQYAYEDKQKDTLNDRIKRFENFGTGRSVQLENTHKVFDPISIFENKCTFVKKAMEKAEKTHYLTHPERLALCSFLSYTDEALEYLLYILSQCSDFNASKSNFHISDWIHRRDQGTGGRPFTCRALNEQGIGCGNCDKLVSKNKMINVNGTLHETSEGADPSPFRLLYKTEQKGL